MNEKIDINLQDIEKTLLIPLWSRAKESELSNPILVDTTARDLINKLDFDFSSIENNSTFLKRLMFLVRAKIFDDTIKNFISKNNNIAIINLGAGLDTTFNRVDDGTLDWYNIDLPNVIELRKKLLPSNYREVSIAKSFLDYSWIGDIEKKYNKILFIAGGLFAYFDKNVIKEFLEKLADNFPNSEIIFDAPASKTSNSKANKNLKKYSVNNVELKLAIKNIKELKELSTNIEIIDYFSFFEKIKLQKEWGILNIIKIKVSNMIKISNFYYIRLINNNNNK